MNKIGKSLTFLSRKGVLNSKMNKRTLKTVLFRPQLEAILNEMGLSPEELAKKSGVSKTTIYSILNNERPRFQRSVVRKIAESVNWDYNIEGEKVTLSKKTGLRGDAKEKEISTTEPPDFDFDNLERMGHRDRQRLIEYINNTAFKGQMNGEIKDIFERLLKSDPDVHAKFNAILKILGS